MQTPITKTKIQNKDEFAKLKVGDIIEAHSLIRYTDNVAAILKCIVTAPTNCLDSAIATDNMLYVSGYVLEDTGGISTVGDTIAVMYCGTDTFYVLN